MRFRIILAALLAGTIVTPAIAQDREGRMERRERGDITRGVNQGRDTGMRAQRVERQERRQELRQERQQAQPQVQAQQQIQPQVRPERRMRVENGPNGGWQRRQVAPPAGAVAVQRRDRDGDGIRNRIDRDRDGDGIRNRRDWDRNNDGTVDRRWDRNRNGVVDRRFDRDGDGVRNRVDRDRDNDGIRNRRDWDRNNNGVVDRRWDRNNNGVVDRRYDRNRDGVRDNNWNGQRYGNNQGWNRQWRNDNRYDWQRYRTSNRNLFRQPRYYSPYGYNHSYQRFGIGVYLDSVFFGSRYRLSDPWQYRLPYAEYPYEWVRYYDDVILVDTRNGYIVDVIHNFFW